MGYQVKWVEENLGVTRKALRHYEELGLMPKNKDRKYRDYTEEDIDRIWTIKLFQGMRFTLKEIVEMVHSAEQDNFDFFACLEEKIKELEADKLKAEKYLGYAQKIKLTGRFPNRPKNLGDMSFGDFYEKSLDGWNLHGDPEGEAYKEMADLMLNCSEEDIVISELEKLLPAFQCLQEIMANPDTIMVEKIIPLQIIKRMEKGPADPEIQLLVKMLYENKKELSPELNDMTLNQFVRFESSSYIAGDVARLKEKEYGKESCLFIANAIAIFGGYNSYDDIED